MVAGHGCVVSGGGAITRSRILKVRNFGGGNTPAPMVTTEERILSDMHHIEMRGLSGKWTPVWGTGTSSLLEAYGYCVALGATKQDSPLRVNPEYEAREKEAHRLGVKDRIPDEQE